MPDQKDETEEKFEPTPIEDIYDEAPDTPEPEPSKEDKDKVEKEPEEEKASEKESEKSEEDKEAKPEEKESKGLISAMLAERGKRQALETENKELKEKLVPAEVTEPISVFNDEAGFVAEQDAKVATTLYQERLANSQEDAIEKYGEEIVETAMTRLAELTKDNQQLAVRFTNARRPFMEAVRIVKEHEEESAARDWVKDPENSEVKARADERKKVILEIEQLAAKEKVVDDSLPESTLDTSSKDALTSEAKEFKRTPIEQVYPD